MKIAFVQISGGIGAQIIGALARQSLKEKGYYVFLDARYFGKNGRNFVPEGISFFEKALSEKLLPLRNIEKVSFFCKVVKLLCLIGVKILPRNFVVYVDKVNQDRTMASEAAEFVYNSRSGKFLSRIRNELFRSLGRTSKVDILAHMRRGDYEAAGLPMTPLSQILDLAGNFIGQDDKLTIITDSPDKVANEMKQLNEKTQNLEIQTNSFLVDLYTVANSKKFISSDSQFSLVAIWLSQSIEHVACPVRYKNEKVVIASRYKEIVWY